MEYSHSRFELKLDGETLSPKNLVRASQDYDTKLSVHPQSIERLKHCHVVLHRLIEEDRVIYGVNTGLGGFVDWLIPPEKAQKLQEYLIHCVATNVGPYIEDSIVRGAMVARLNSLCRGNSGISVENFNQLLAIFNAGIVPCVPSKGSLGASGDLGPLAAIALVATGKWKAKFRGKVMPASQALKSAGITPMTLSYKEGLALVNGTSFMSSYGAFLVEKAFSLVETYEYISALSFESLNAKINPFDPRIHLQKPHAGQQLSAKVIWETLQDSKMIEKECVTESRLKTHRKDHPTQAPARIEDAYSIRCTPQILGPIRDTLTWIEKVVIDELNSSNDNPTVSVEDEAIFHNGHFHGQYIASAMDYLSISLTTLCNLSDRRIDRFMDANNSNGLPPFLCTVEKGVNLGLMGGQFMSTSLTAENRALCSPVSTQSLTSTGDFQDIVSLGLVSARKTDEIYNNACYVVAFELICGVTAAKFRGDKLLSSSTKKIYDFISQICDSDFPNSYLTEHIEKVADSVRQGEILKLLRQD